MKRTFQFASPLGRVSCDMPDGTSVELPVFAGIFKHLSADELPRLLRDHRVAVKYTRLALQKAAWQLLREYPRDWLLACMDSADLRPSRKAALLFLLRAGPYATPP